MTVGRWTPVIAWATTILIATSLPSQAVPSGPAGIDKAGHFGVYAVLGVLAMRAALTARMAPVKRIVIVVAAASAFAALDEWHQGFIPGRYPDVADWVADVAGVTVGVGSMALFTFRRSARS